MLHISTFMYSEDTIQDPQAKSLHIVNPTMVFKPTFIPSLYSFSVTLSIVGLEFQKDPKLRFKFWSENEPDKMLVDTGEIPLPKNNNDDSDLPEEFRGGMLTMNFRNLPLKYQGKYFSEVFIDEESLGTFPVFAKIGGVA